MEAQTTKSPKKATIKSVWANLSNTHYLSVRQCMEEMGIRITESETKNMILWCDAGGSTEVATGLLPWQFYNHFPGIWSISRKAELARNFDRMNRVLPNVMDFHPKSFLLPGQFSDLKTFMNSIPKKSDRTFIVKPDRGSQGKGILIIQDPDDIDEYYEMAVAQQYIEPFLIDGYKFDLRIYALLTSIEPLRIYIYQEGMARFCTEPYAAPKTSNLDQVYSHLTNYSLNKKNDNFQQPENAYEANKGSKRSLTSVYKEIEKCGGDISKIQHDIESIIRITIGSVQPFLLNNYNSFISSKDEKSRCFEILGFDILLDSSLKPWLLEVNCMPSLTCDSPFDTQLKFGVIKGTLKILNLVPNFKKQVINRQKAVTQVRISGSTKIKIPTLFDPLVETELSKTTLWKQIYPILDNESEDPNNEIKAELMIKKSENKNVNDEEEIIDEISDSYIMNQVLTKAREYPVGAVVDTTASRARKEAVCQQIKQFEQQQTYRPQPPKSMTKKKQVDTENEPKKKFKPPPRVASIAAKPKMNLKTIENLTANSNNAQIKLMTEFSGLPCQTIDENEERERIRNIRQQQLLTSSSNMLNLIKTFFLPQSNMKSNTQPSDQSENKVFSVSVKSTVSQNINTNNQPTSIQIHSMNFGSANVPLPNNKRYQPTIMNPQKKKTISQQKSDSNFPSKHKLPAVKTHIKYRYDY